VRAAGPEEIRLLSGCGFALWPERSTLVDVKTAVKTRWLVQSVALGTLVAGAWAQVPGKAPTVASVTTAPADTRIFPLSQVKRGLRGVAYTVFEGVNPEPMDVEILGVLKDALGPGQDMILARLHGAKPEYTGVVAGMSGSPVYIDGRLVGALSYRIGQFSKDPIAGITPIEYMLAVRDGEVRPVGTGAGGRASVSSSEGQTEVRAMETPLVFGGFSQEAVNLFGDRFRAMGLTPVAGLGGSDANALQPEPVVPGSAVSAVLVRGDLSMAGTCTVTYVDPTRLLACGHPITQYGPVDMPMTKAEVVATLASPLNAFKIVNTTQTVGAFTEDRASAILGRFGATARMIPVAVEVVPSAMAGKPAPEPKTMHFEVLDNRQLTPSAVLVSIYQSLQGTNAAAAEMSFRVDGELSVEGQSPVQLHGLMTQNELNSGAINTALFVGSRFSKVYENSLDQPTITGLKLKVEAIPERRAAVLETARLSRMEARAGETIEVETTLHPYQAEPRVLRMTVKLPAVLSPGPLRVLVSDGATVDKLTQPTGATAQYAAGLADTVDQLNQSRANDKIYVTLLDHAAQVVLQGESLPDVPLSMANVLGPLKDSQRMQLTGESVVEVGSQETGYSVTGSQVLNLLVR
jgi:SpoIVB peptidase S55